MSRIGIALVDATCARAKQVWRETPHTDVGLDGQIEFRQEERATGVLMGVQVKTGASYVSQDGETFFLRSDREHFEYWATCVIPVIGIVVDPNRDMATWVDLTATCSTERIESGPYTIPIARSPSSAFSVDALVTALPRLAHDYSHQRVTRWQVDGLKVEPVPTSTDSDKPACRLAVNALCAVFGSGQFASADLAIVAHRLSWYYPSVAPAYQEHLRRALAQFSDVQIARALGAARSALDAERTDVAEFVADLLALVPSARQRLLSMLEARVLTRDDREVVIQMLELWDEQAHGELRAAFLP